MGLNWAAVGFESFHCDLPFEHCRGHLCLAQLVAKALVFLLKIAVH